MGAIDFKLIETGQGGDLVLLTNDLQTISGYGNMIYLALFGGNIEQSTPTRRLENEQAFDFWGNRLFHINNPDIQFNSETERILQNVALNSNGRILIIESVKKDLQFMSEFCTIEVDASINQVNRININIRVIEPTNNQQSEFQYIWDGTKKDLINE
jgi:phage gp46-like protein